MAALLQTNGSDYIENLLELCDVPTQKIHVEYCKSNLSKVPSLTLSSGITVQGLNTVAVYIASVSSIGEALLGETPLGKAEVHQWLEYGEKQVKQALLSDKSYSKPVLQDLNCHLVNKVFLAGATLSLADVMLYYGLRKLLSDMMPQERETYINISRWFQQVQSLLSTRQALTGVSFHRNLLYS